MPAVPRPGGVDPHPRPRPAVGAARGRVALLGARIGHSSQPHATVSHDTVDLVVLTDYLIADPRIPTSQITRTHGQGSL
jgi:hypothetical protein